MLGFAVIPGAMQFFGFFFLPESPRFLYEKGNHVEAKRVCVILLKEFFGIPRYFLFVFKIILFPILLFASKKTRRGWREGGIREKQQSSDAVCEGLKLKQRL